MNILTWNVNKASLSRSELCKAVRCEHADIVLLQEATRIPDWNLAHYSFNCNSMHPRFFDGRNAWFQTMVLTKWAMNKRSFLTSELEWVNKIHAERYGWILGCEVVHDAGARFRVVSAHAPAFHVPWKFLEGVHLSSIKLQNNPKLWFTEILCPCSGTRPSPRIRTGSWEVISTAP